MEIVHEEPRPGLLVLHGELSVETATKLQPVMFSALRKTDRLDVDLLNVSRIDTAGVQLLLVLHREARAEQRALAWLGFSLAVEEVIELLGLWDVIGRPEGVVWS